MAKASVAIVGDAASFLRAVRQSVGGARSLGVAFTELGVDARKSAAVQVQASLKRDSALRTQIAALRAEAAASPRGSRQAVAASNLAAAAELRLSRSHTVTAREAGKLSKSARSLERDIGKSARGALAGSGIFKGLGRSLAFASGGYLAFAGGIGFLEKSVEAAREEGAVQRQLEVQLRANGQSWAAYRSQVEATTLKLSDVSGFTKVELISSLGLLSRSTGDVNSALKLNAVAADVARGRHISLQMAAIALGKAWAGNTTGLQRLGIILPKGVSGYDAINTVAARFAGQAKAGATAADRFNATLHNSEEIIGAALLPTVNQIVGSVGRWLTKMNESGRLQRDVNSAVNTGVRIFKDAKAAIDAIDKVTGGFKNTLELLIAVKVATTVGRWATALRGASAAAGALGKNLKTLGAIGAITITVDVVEKILAGGRSNLNPLQSTIGATDQMKSLIARFKAAAAVYNAAHGAAATLPVTNEAQMRGASALAALAKRSGSAARALPPGTGAPGNDLAALQLEAARAAATGSKTAIVAAARDLVSKLQDAIPRLKGNELLGALRLEARERGVINKAQTAAAKEAAKAAKKQQEAAQRLEDAAKKQKAKDLAAAQKAVAAAQAQIGTLFQGPVLAPTQEQTLAMLGASPSPQRLLADLQAQTAEFVRFSRDLKTIAKRGGGASFVRELRGLGVAGASDVHAIASAPKALFAQFKRAELQRLAAVREAAVVNLRTPKVSLQAHQVLMAGKPSKTQAAAAAHAADRPLHVHLHVDGHHVAKAVLPHLQRKAERSAGGGRSGRYAGKGLIG